MEPVRLLSPKELKRINDASAIMHEHSRIVRSLMLVNEKIARARFTTFYAPKASQHLLRRLLPRKRKLLARLRVVRTRRKAFNARHR